MVRVVTFAAMTAAAFVFWQSMDHLHVWIALRQDEKRHRERQEMEIAKTREKILKQLGGKQA